MWIDPLGGALSMPHRLERRCPLEVFSMAAPRPLRPPGADPPALHARAMDNLRYIRDTMERAAWFTAVSGWGLLAMGGTALGAAVVAALQPGAAGWLATWLGEALLALAIAVAATWRKA